jgi:hypothetical protein
MKDFLRNSLTSLARELNDLGERGALLVMLVQSGLDEHYHLSQKWFCDGYWNEASVRSFGR